MKALAHDWLDPADVYANDPILATLKLHKPGQVFVPATVQGISPLGLDVTVDAAAFTLGVVNCEIDVQLAVAGQTLDFRTLVIGRSATISGQVQLALRFASVSPGPLRGAKDINVSSEVDDSAPHLWGCSAEFFPTALALNPARYNDYIYFKVLAISARGLRMVCSQRNKMLLPNLRLRLQMSLPMVGDSTFDVRVDRVSVGADDDNRNFEVVVEVLKLENYAREMIAQYLIQFGRVDSLDALRADGLNPPSVARGVDFYFLRSKQDHAEVLKLRLAAHRQFGNLSCSDVRAEDLDDPVDDSARILIGKHSGRTVASARLRFLRRDQPLPMQAHIHCSEALPPHDQMVEVSRACTDPEYRRGNLFANVVHQLFVSSIPAGRPYILLVSLPNLLSFYKSIGCKQLGPTQRDEFWNGEQHLMLINAVNVCLGRDVGPAVWNLMFREPYDYLLEQGALHPALLDRIRLACYRGVGLVTDLWFWLFRPKILV